LKKRLPQTDQSSTEPNPRRRARKSKTAKKDFVPEAPKIEHVNCMELQEDQKNNNGNDSSNNNSSINVSVRPTGIDMMNQPVSPQPCTSSSEISTVTSASELNYDNGSKEMNQMMVDERDYFGDLLQIDNDFWTDVLPPCIEDTAISTENHAHIVSEPCSNTSPEFLMMEPQGLGLNYQDDMDFFWYHLLIRSNELTELSQVL